MIDPFNEFFEYEISLKYSASGTPLIDLGDPELGKLIFSKMTAHPEKGYKWLCWSRKYMDLVAVKRAGVRTVKKMEVQDGAVFNLKMKRNAEGNKGVPQGTLPRPLVNWFINTFDKLSPDGTWLPYDQIPVLEKLINKTDFNKVIKKKAQKPKKRTARKAKKRTAGKAKKRK